MYKLIKAEKERWRFQELFNSYIVELSQYNPALAEHKDKFGDYLPEEVHEYFNNPCKKPYLIKLGKDYAGFVVFSRPDAEDGDDGCDIYIEEMFVDKPFRRRGTASAVSSDYLAENGGRVCGLCVLKGNEDALGFWTGFFEKRGIETEQLDGDDVWLIKARI